MSPVAAQCNACGATFPVGHSHVCRSRETHYFTRRVGVDYDEVYAYWPHDGTLARLTSGDAEWVAVPGPDYRLIRAELEHPERTVPGHVPVADQPEHDPSTIVWDGKPWKCRCPNCQPKP